MVIVIAGPTGVGKTKLSIELAKKLNGEVINADSTQVYKNLNIATAKVTEKEKENIIHHLFDIKEIDDDYTVYDYQKDARRTIDEILKRGKTPILVGGTGLYIKASLYDYQFDKEKKKRDYSNYSDDELYELLMKVDPNSNIHKNNRKRVERAYAYFENHHIPFSSKEKNNTLLYDTIFIGLTTERSILYKRIDKRVDKMVTDGLLNEAKNIYESNIRTKAITTPIGYKELFPYFEGKAPLENCLDTIKKNSRKYAKRQYTWFYHQLPMTWFTVCFEDFNKTIDEVYHFINQKKS